MTDFKPSIHIALDLADFKALVSGGIVEAEALVTAPGRVAVRIILSDIGWAAMYRALAEAKDAAQRGGTPP